MMSRVSAFILKFFGWKIVLDYDEIPIKYVMIVIPHTSNWDFPIGVLVRSAIKLKVVFLAKKEIFQPPFGFIFKWLNGQPVDRSKSRRFVDAVVDLFNSKEQFAVCISPEGTRKKVTTLKTGFYWMAHGAKVPIIMCKFDWENRIVGMSKPYFTSGDFDADLPEILSYFEGVKGKRPEMGYL